MKIVVVSTFYSEGMGYAENCLPKFLALRGHEVHVITSEMNVYGNEPGYAQTYESFLGPARQPLGSFPVDGYVVHRLAASNVGGYVRLRGLPRKLRELSPDIVHSMEVASVQTFALAGLRLFSDFRLFAETHQHLSVMKPYMREGQGQFVSRLAYRATRTVPTFLASTAVERCYAIAPDCAFVANEYYGVPRSKIVVQSLGTDTELFRPAAPEERANGSRIAALRTELGFDAGDVICIYTGRFSRDKNPLLLAKAVELLAGRGIPFRGLFIGEGVQRDEIAAQSRSVVVPFMKQRLLGDYYRMADVAVWPTQESMSMLDAASAGLPVVASDRIGESERIAGNGAVYREGDAGELAHVLLGMASAEHRALLGRAGRAKVLEKFSWSVIAGRIEADYLTATSRESR